MFYCAWQDCIFYTFAFVKESTVSCCRFFLQFDPNDLCLIVKLIKLLLSLENDNFLTCCFFVVFIAVFCHTNISFCCVSSCFGNRVLINAHHYNFHGYQSCRCPWYWAFVGPECNQWGLYEDNSTWNWNIHVLKLWLAIVWYSWSYHPFWCGCNTSGQGTGLNIHGYWNVLDSSENIHTHTLWNIIGTFEGVGAWNAKCFKGKNTMLNYLEFPVEWIKPKNPMGRDTDILWKSILSTKLIFFFKFAWLPFVCQVYSLAFSNSLIFHQLKTKRITTMKEVWIPHLN